ncbi:Hint domain-containing protein [Maritimibacter sp. UBA3975]|uniref:Hint domain-containing protein n=1 Tax=Maritimibacter sp. UBA3975 TaxID=1946833 RepID=UPI0025B9B233|nr:Hint domain-containing protein [Maritimibacter sp. UBA3975]
MTGSGPDIMPDAGPLIPAGFVAGTQIATPDGPRRVEALGPGDAVRATDGRTLPVLWCAETRLRDAPEAARPVRIKPGTFGAREGLFIAPGTLIVVDRRDAALVPAGWLAEGGVPGLRVARGQASPVYHHLLLAEHAVLDTGGVLVTPFYPDAQARQALDPAARRSLHFLMPKLQGAERVSDVTRAYAPPAHPCLSRDEFALLREDAAMIAPVGPEAGAA